MIIRWLNLFKKKNRVTMTRSCEAVDYYLSILERNGFPFPVKRLIGYRGQASTVVQNVAKNEEELSVFLSSFPRIFQIKNCTVLLQPNYLHELNRKSSVHYYSKIVAQYSPCLGLAINKLFGHRGQAPSDISVVANNPLELHALLLDFPETFIVKDDVVFLTGYDKLIENAVDYYSNILTKISPNKKFPIHRLIGYRGQASLDIQCIAKNKKEFIKFFSCHPNIFTVTKSMCVKLNKATSNNKIINRPSCLQENNEDKAVEFYRNILSGIIPPYSDYQITHLIGHRGQAPYNVQVVAKNEKDLAILLCKYPNTFNVSQDNKYVRLTKSVKTVITLAAPSVDAASTLAAKSVKTVNTLAAPSVDAASTLAAKSVKTVSTLATPPSVDPASTLAAKSVKTVSTLAALSPNDWIDRVLKNTTVINDLESCKIICRMIGKEKIIVLDCEGYNLGNGIISIIQIGLMSGNIYLFDIFKEPKMVVNGGLSEILGSEIILKIVNYCPNDSINLMKQFAVALRNVFDVSIAYHVIENNSSSLSYFKALGLNEMCKKYGVPINNSKDALKDIYKLIPGYWLIRPMNKIMVAYAAQDVASLPYLYTQLLKRLDFKTTCIVMNLTEKLCRR